MSDLLLGGLLPRRWQWDKIAPWYVDLVIINWLETEIEMNAQQRLPMLAEIHGHRNREVYDWLHETRDHRDADICRSIYGVS